MSSLILVSMCSFAVTLKPATTIEMPGPAGKRFDCPIDYDDHYLLSAHLAGRPALRD